jgi:hypothetical protein
MFDIRSSFGSNRDPVDKGEGENWKRETKEMLRSKQHSTEADSPWVRKRMEQSERAGRAREELGEEGRKREKWGWVKSWPVPVQPGSMGYFELGPLSFTFGSSASVCVGCGTGSGWSGLDERGALLGVRSVGTQKRSSPKMLVSGFWAAPDVPSVLYERAPGLMWSDSGLRQLLAVQ